MSDVYDVVIIGGGITGLSAGIYTTRAKLKTVLVERSVFGGQIINADVIENYPGFPNGVTGIDLVTTTEEQASKFGLDYAFGEVTGIEVGRQPLVVRTADEEFQTRAIIVSSGGDHVKLGVPGEKELEAKGVSYCATCDGNFFTGQPVAVIGGGDSALDEGLYLTRMCEKVTVIHRRDTLRAAQVLQERALANPKIEFIWDTVVESINGNGKGNGNGQVGSLTLRNVKTGDQSELIASGVFIYVGFKPNSSPFQGVLDMDAGGHVKVDLMMRTNVPGVFAAGDIRWQSTRQLANAAGDGVTAAIAAYEYLEASG